VVATAGSGQSRQSRLIWRCAAAAATLFPRSNGPHRLAAPEAAAAVSLGWSVSARTRPDHATSCGAFKAPNQTFYGPIPELRRQHRALRTAPGLKDLVPAGQGGPRRPGQSGSRNRTPWWWRGRTVATSRALRGAFSDPGTGRPARRLGESGAVGLRTAWAWSGRLRPNSGIVLFAAARCPDRAG